MSSANRRLVLLCPAILIIPSRSSSTSDIIVSRKILENVGVDPLIGTFA